MRGLLAVDAYLDLLAAAAERVAQVLYAFQSLQSSLGLLRHDAQRSAVLTEELHGEAHAASALVGVVVEVETHAGDLRKTVADLAT